MSGPEKGVITNSLESLESLDNGRIRLCFPESGGFSRLSRISRRWIFLKRHLSKRPFVEPEKVTGFSGCGTHCAVVNSPRETESPVLYLFGGDGLFLQCANLGHCQDKWI